MRYQKKEYTQIVIIKADDCTGWRANWPKFISIIKKYKIKAGVGIIGKGLLEAPTEDVAYLRENFTENHIEFWNHGWTHWSYPDHYVIPDTYEFKGRSLTAQHSAIVNTQEIIKKRLNYQCRTFGEPHNRFDQNTCKALDKCYDIKIWFGWNNSLPSKKFILNINSYIEEGWPGKIDSVKFLKSYESEYKKSPYLLFQIHPTSPWEDESWEEFGKIIHFLLLQQVVFMTPYEYLLHQKRSPVNIFLEKIIFHSRNVLKI